MITEPSTIKFFNLIRDFEIRDKRLFSATYKVTVIKSLVQKVRKQGLRIPIAIEKPKGLKQ